MKQIFPIVFGLVVLISCNNGSSTGTANAASEDFSGYELSTIPGSTAKRAIKKDTNGKILEQGVIENGQRNGQWITFNTENNLPKTITNFKDGKYTGLLIEYNNRGQIEKMTSYLDNVLDGHYGQYKFGRTIEEGTYVNGQLEGVYRTYFNNKDVIQQEMHYKNGKLDGNAKWFNEEGAVVMEYEYKNGEKVSGGVVGE